MKYVFTLMLVASGWAHAVTCSTVPAGAAALGYTRQLFYEQPQLNEVSTTDEDSVSKWYPGVFSSTVAANMATRQFLSQSGTELSIGLQGAISSETQASTQGAIPFLNGAQGFYVEFAMRLSSNDSDHFIGLYLQTVEHNLAKSDHFASDPPGFERWSEIDVSESGYGAGTIETFINWVGTYPHYNYRMFNSYGHDARLDWTTEHRFGVSYDPTTNTLQWYLDDAPTFNLVPTGAVIQNFHYFLIMDATSHGSHVPYEMFIRYVTAYTT